MKIKYLNIVIVVLSTFFYSCDRRDYDVPEIKAPSYSTSKEIISIADLKTLSSTFPLPFIVDGYENKVGNFEVRSMDNTNKAIKGIVTANDESGNIYKQFYIQDNTGAITIGSNLTGLFGLFTIGQEVIIELDGLNVGKYGGSFQIGGRIHYVSYNPNGSVKNASIGRLVPEEFHTHIFRNGKANPASVVPTVLTSMPVITEANRNTLVRFDNVSFVGGGSAIFATKGAGYGTVQLNIGGQNVGIRTSEYADFAADTIPTGTGSVICILGKYNNDNQLTIRSRKDLIFN